MSTDPIWGIMDLPQTLNPYVYTLNNPATYTDDSGELVLEIVALSLLGYGLYKGLEAMAHSAEEFGESYGEVLDTVGDPQQGPEDYDRAASRFRSATRNVQRETLRLAVTQPGTSLTGPATIPTTWTWLAIEQAKDWLWKGLVDWVLGSDSTAGRIQPTEGQRYWTGASPADGGGGGGGGGGSWTASVVWGWYGDGGWGSPPSGGK